MQRLAVGEWPVEIPEAVLEGLEAVRRSGLTNMLDRPRVAQLAESFGFEESAAWVRANRKAYAEGVFRGSRADRWKEETPAGRRSPKPAGDGIPKPTANAVNLLKLD